MPRTVGGGLSIEKLRELARAGAEDALKRLRAEIVAIRANVPGACPPACSPDPPPVGQGRGDSNSPHVRRRTTGRFRTNAKILG
jgi:hypothetical protein